MSTPMTMTMPKILADLGHRLTGASDNLTLDEAISSLDHVRKAAFTNNIEAMSMKPPVLLCDNLEPSSFFLHNQKVVAEEFKRGSPNLFKIKGLCVMGGCVMHTKRCIFPVVLLFSSQKNAMIIHADCAPIAALEAEMYDSAFEKGDSWETTVLGEEASEVMQWRREASIATRNIGYHNMPQFAMNTDDMYVTRHGVVPYLSLRAVFNQGECDAVRASVNRMLRIFPPMPSTPNYAQLKHSSILLATTFTTSAVYLNKDATERVITKAELDEVCSNAVMTAVANIIIKYGDDNATDHNDDKISEVKYRLQEHHEHKSVLQSCVDIEMIHYQVAKATTTTSLWQVTNFDDAYSLPNVMRHMGRSYTTKILFDGEVSKEDNLARAVIEAVAAAAFDNDDLSRVVATFGTSFDSSSITIPTAIGVLGKCLIDEQAIMIASRDTDGRFGQVRLVGGKLGAVAQVGRHAFPRLACLCPWVTTVIVDKNVVSMLLVADVDCVVDSVSFCAVLKQEKLQLREKGQAVDHGVVDQLKKHLVDVTAELASVKGLTAQLKASNDVLISDNSTLDTSVKELTRKVDVLINLALKDGDADTSTFHSIKSGDELDSNSDQTFMSLKRSLAVFQALHMRTFTK